MAYGGNVNPSRNRKGEAGNPPPTGARASALPDRGLGSRPTQDVGQDREIGQPINSEKCSETTEGVARESEGRT